MSNIAFYAFHFEDSLRTAGKKTRDKGKLLNDFNSECYILRLFRLSLELSQTVEC